MSKDYLLPAPNRSMTSKAKKSLSNTPRSSVILPRRTYSMEYRENDSYNQDREIRQLLDTVPVLPKLSKMPDISKYLNKSKSVNKKKTISDRRTIIKNYM